MDTMTRTIQEHGQAVWATVWRMLNHEADAQDCYQDTFLEAQTIADRGAIRCWRSLLKTIATRRALDRLRTRYRERPRTRSLDSPMPAPLAQGPLHQARADELMDRLREALAQLPNPQAQAFWMHQIEQTPYAQIAVILEVEPGHARVLAHRARKQLQQSLAQFQPEQPACPVSEVNQP